MVPKKEKRKRKKDHKENDDEDSADKYVAYVIKPKKSKKSMESTSAASKTVSEPLTDKQKVKTKTAKEVAAKFGVLAISDNDSDTAAGLSISAKPKLYQDARKSKTTNVSSKKTSKGKKKKDNASNQKTFNDSLANWRVDDATGIEIITPKETMEPVDKDGNIIPMVYTVPYKYEYDIEYKDTFDYDMKPVVIEAVLKKPTSYYLPKVLRDPKPKNKKETKSKHFKDKLSAMNQEIIEKGSVTSDTNTGSCIDLDIQDTQDNSTVQPATNESSDKSNTAENSNTEVNGISNEEQDSHIPDALKEFYAEVTGEFENLANKSSNLSKKSKKKSALTVDESVTDERTSANVVSRNNFQLENTVSTYQQDIAKFFSLENKVILVLSPATQFSFLGKLKIQVLYGAVELYGSLFNSQNTSKPIEVYSPRGYSSISISTSSTNGTHDKEALWDRLKAEGVDRSIKTKLHDAIRECKDGWSVLLLENFENTLTSFLNSYSSFKLFPKIDNMKYSWCDPKRAECVLQAYFQFTRSSDEISINPQWNENVTKQLLEQWQMTKSTVTMITGGKGVGKSTTARYLINNLLRHSEKVILLDLDIGQAEMTPPGSVSLSVIEEPLLGPNFTHLKMPYLQMYLEDVSVMNCLGRYVECTKKLIDCLKSKKDLQQYPVVVNTMGFCKGIGLDICIFLIKLIQPSNVVQIKSKRARNNFDFALVKKTVNEYKTSSLFLGDDNAVFDKSCDYELHSVPSVAEGKRQFETWNMEPRQQRKLVLLSYLSQIIKNADDQNYCNVTSNSINNIVPYTLPFSSFYITLIKSNISPTRMLSAMNGNIVALCGADLDEETSQEDREALKYPMVVINPPSCTCYGYGIVRGIDMKRREVYINTPLKKSDLRHVNLLAGCTPVPFTLLHRDAPYAGDRGELPTSREPRRGNFRVDKTRNA